jgi:DnaJ family protein A protein 2
MAGDVILYVIIEDHPLFERKGADLFMKKKISLLEALTGFYFTIEHLDHSKLTISTNPGDVVMDGSKKIIKNKGMPFYKDSMNSGNLIIEFNVEYPKQGELKDE